MRAHEFACTACNLTLNMGLYHGRRRPEPGCQFQAAQVFAAEIMGKAIGPTRIWSAGSTSKPELHCRIIRPAFRFSSLHHEVELVR
jgi:hypothetical protein